MFSLGKATKTTAIVNGSGDAKDVEVKTEDLLAKSADLVRDLYSAQYRRLGSDFTTTGEERSLRPSPRETQTAHRLVGNLIDLVGRLSSGPGDLLPSREPVRRALSISGLPEPSIDANAE